MTPDARHEYPLESMRGVPDRHSDGYRVYSAASPGGFNTPTSDTFSTGPDSPGWGSAVHSPMASHSRSNSVYAFGEYTTPARRLSVPSGASPFHFASPTQQFAQDRSGPYSPYSGNSSLLSSPTTPTSDWSRRESVSSVAEDANRRRTWHQGSHESRSRLSQVINTSQLDSAPVLPPPLTSPNQQQERRPQRLPGIESFGPYLPPRKRPSSMITDSESSNPREPRDYMPVVGNMLDEDRRAATHQLDPSLHRGITGLDINASPRDGATAWANEANRAVLAQADQFRLSQAPPVVRSEAVPIRDSGERYAPPMSSRHQHTVSAPIGNANKRRGWLNGPIPSYRARETIHEGRTQDRIVHPNMNQFQGFPARDNAPIVHQQPPGMSTAGHGHPEGHRNGLSALDTLVAVAANEASAGNRHQNTQEREQSGDWKAAVESRPTTYYVRSALELDGRPSRYYREDVERQASLSSQAQPRRSGQPYSDYRS